MSYWEAVEFLREQVTILDYPSLDKFGKDMLDAATVGINHGVCNLFHLLPFSYLSGCFGSCRGVIYYVSYTKHQPCLSYFSRIQLLVPNQNSKLEKVILRTTVWIDKPRMKEAYTIFKFEWMVVEVNDLWRRKHKTLNMTSQRIPFFAAFAIRTWSTNPSLHGTCNKTMYDVVKDNL